MWIHICRYYHETFHTYGAGEQMADIDCARFEFAKVVFSIETRSVVVESFFSAMGRNLNKQRAGLGDKKVADIMQTRDCKGVVEDTSTPFTHDIHCLDVDAALKHDLPLS